MPDLIKLLLRNAALGFAVAAIFVAALLLTDTGGIGTLVLNSSDGALATAVLTFFVGLTFGSVQMGIAVMSGDWDGEGRPPRRKRAVLALPMQPKFATIPVKPRR